METYKLVGMSEPMDFTTSDGKEIHGRNLYLTAPIEDGKGTGLLALKLFLKKEVEAKIDPAVLTVNNEVVLYYNRFGKVISIASADSDTVIDF